MQIGFMGSAPWVRAWPPICRSGPQARRQRRAAPGRASPRPAPNGPTRPEGGRGLRGDLPRASGPPEVEAVDFGGNGLVADIRRARPASTSPPTRRAGAQDRCIFAGRACTCSMHRERRARRRQVGPDGDLVGGDEAVFDRYKSVLDATAIRPARRPDGRRLGRQAPCTTARVCRPGRARRGLRLGVKGGVEPRRYGRRCGPARSAGAAPSSGSWTSSCPARTTRRLALGLAHKDVTLATRLGRELGVPCAGRAGAGRDNGSD